METNPRAGRGSAPPRVVRSVRAIRVASDGATGVGEDCRVIVERALTITVDDVGAYTIMCTPCDEKALAVGFAFSEGIISGVDDIRFLAHCDEMPGALRMKVASPAHAVSGRNLAVASSCGACGSRTVEELASALEPVGDSLRVPAEVLSTVAGKMRSLQKLFAETGGTHAAAVFATSGEIVAFAEDVGRHNALDKVVGKCLLQRRSPAGCSAMLSGRISFELVAKAAKAGLELAAGASAPTSLAVEIAERTNITLCGFVRGRRATVYTHPHRIRESTAEARDFVSREEGQDRRGT